MISNKTIIASIIITTTLLSSIITYAIIKHNTHHRIPTSTKSEKITETHSNNFDLKRIEGYQYIKPLEWAEEDLQSTELTNLQNKIIKKIESYKKDGSIASASVYLKIFGKEKWFCINDTETYFPGSLMKVAGLISYLRMEENTPGLLNKKITFNTPVGEIIPNQTFNSNRIKPGETHTVKELLKYMVAYSDNNATFLLNKNVDNKAFLKLFSDLNITLKSGANGNALMNVKDYSRLLTVIYNSSYLSINHSEYAAELLSQCDFKKGMVKALPPNTKVVHKFGEMGDSNYHQLHESGIIYSKNETFLLTIMTKGVDVNKLPDVISDITKITYKNISEISDPISIIF